MAAHGKDEYDGARSDGRVAEMVCGRERGRQEAE